MNRHALLLIALLACGSEDDEPMPSAPVAEPGELDASTPRAEAAAPTCMEGATSSCACSGGLGGKRTCHAERFGDCVCEQGTLAKCVAGRYQGAFEMTYRSSPGGFCGVFAELTESPARGAWTFDLSSQGGEFSYIVSGGCLASDANTSDAGITTPPIHALLEGSVDCASGKLTGTLRGTYRATSVCTLGTQVDDYFFRGTMTGTFDPATQSFVDTHVTWSEPPVLLGPQPGGTGSWSGKLLPTAPPAAADCLAGVDFPDELFPDAGM